MTYAPAAGDVREPRKAGLFYAGKRDELKAEITQLLENAERLPDVEKIWGLIAPHAGYLYSGQVAAEAYIQLEGKSFDTVFVVAPSHGEYFEGISVFTGKGYATPLGEIPVDQEISAQLIQADSCIQASWAGHRDEHALEVQLPFIQMVLKDIKIVPVVMGIQNIDNVAALARAMADIGKQNNVLYAASCDLSHFHSYAAAVSLDKIAMDCIEKFDDERLWENIRSKKCEACGFGPVISVMRAAKLNGAKKTKVLAYKNSGDITGDMYRVVGYMSALIYDPAESS